MMPPNPNLGSMYQPGTQNEPRDGLDPTQATITKNNTPEIEPDDADCLDPDPITDLDVDQPITEASDDDDTTDGDA